jgi:hypothetical protein
VGRDGERLNALAAQLGANARVVVAGSVDATVAALRDGGAKVVVNTIGPFGETALPVIRACGPDGHYLDLSNEPSSTGAVLALHDEAASADEYLASGVSQFELDQPGLKGMLTTYRDGRWLLMFTDDEERDEATLREKVVQAVGKPDLEFELITTGRWVP